MKTLIINGTTKEGNSFSGYFSRIAMIPMKGEKEYTKLRTRMDIPRILNSLEVVDTILLVMPTYCDTVPSNILYFLEELEKYSRQNHKHFHIYAIVSCGFIEGRQTQPVFKIIENFCARSHNIWNGGVGIGGGAMLNIVKMSFLIWIGLTLILMLYSGFVDGIWLPVAPLINMLQTTGVVAFFTLPSIIWVFWLVISMNNGKFHKVRYIRATIPKFLFAILGDACFFILSVVRGGFFKGLNRKL